MACLFNEWGNGLLENLWDIMAAIQKGEHLSRSEVRRRLRQGFNSFYAGDSMAEDDILDTLFTFPDGKARCIADHPLRHALDDTERHWLSHMLTMPAARGFLSPSLLQKLSALFPSKGDEGRLVEEGTTLDAPHPDTLPLLQTYGKALLDKKQVELRGIAGLVITGTPVRLAYNLANRKYAFFLWDGRFHRIPLENGITLRLLPTAAEDVEKQWENFLRQHKTSFTLTMKDENNAIERCFSLFASYDKESWRTEEGLYILKIDYYDFDHDEILKFILSLGPQAIVTGPASLRQEIIAILEKEYQYFQAKP